MRRLLLHLGSFLQILVGAGAAQAQTASGDDPGKDGALPYAIAIMSTMLVMVILCIPSRKR